MEINFKSVQNGNEGSALLVVVIMIAILTFMAATLLDSVGTKCRTTYHSGAWVEALNVAETGAEIGVLALNGTNGMDPSTWTNSDWSSSNVASPFVRQYKKKIAGHGTVPDAYVSVLVGPKVTANGKTWCRIRSTGVAAIPGPSSSDFEGAVYDSTNTKNRNLLRNLSLSRSSDKTEGLLSTPQVSRTVEVTAVVSGASSTIFTRPLTTGSSVNFHDAAIFDSFDSTDAKHSVNPVNGLAGQYPGKPTLTGSVTTGSQGNIASNSIINSPGSLWGASGTDTVYGNILANGGNWTAGTTGKATIKGAVKTDWSCDWAKTYPEVTPPSVSYKMTPSTLTPSTIGQFTGGASASSRTWYSLTSFSVPYGTATFSTPTGTPSYIGIYMNNDFLVKDGGAKLVLAPGVNLVIYVNGNFSVTNGCAFNNQSGIAANLQIYCMAGASGSAARTFTMAGGGTFIGCAYAPSFTFDMSNGTSFIGAGVFQKAAVYGGSGMHYDESLGKTGPTLGVAGTTYNVASSVEDIAP